MTARICLHCHDQRRPVSRPRGLCFSCYYAPGVRDLYPALPGGRSSVGSVFPVCWACDAVAPTRSRRLNVGWVSRITRCSPGCPPESETYCPTCFARWGWPPETLYRDKESA